MYDYQYIYNCFRQLKLEYQNKYIRTKVITFGIENLKNINYIYIIVIYNNHL